MIKLLLLLLKGASLGKFLLTGGSMLLSMAVYAMSFGWPFAIGLVGLLLIHEIGHIIAARQKGIATSMPMFIPFMGAAVAMKDRLPSAEVSAYIAMGGPLLGSVAALALFYASRNTGSPLLLVLASTGFFINLINLLPLKPFDGGYVTEAISKKMWLIGAPVLTVWFFYRPSIVLFIIVLMALPHVWRSMRGIETDEERAYHTLSMETRISYSVVYFGLAIFLALMWHSIQLELNPSHAL